MQTSHPRLRLCLGIRRLCILGFGIPHKSNLLVFGFALDTRTPCTLFSGFTHKSHQPPIIRHSAHRYLGSGTLGGWDSALSRRSAEKISHGHKKYRRTWFDQLQCESIRHQWSDMKWPPPRCHPIFKSHIRHCMPGVLHHHLALFTNCVIPDPIITPSNQASNYLFSIIFDSILTLPSAST